MDMPLALTVVDRDPVAAELLARHWTVLAKNSSPAPDAQSERGGEAVQ